jgi:hypothetical protein
LSLVVKFDEGGTGHVTQTVYEESHTAPVLNWFWNNSSGKVDIVNQLKHIDKDLYGSCPEKIYACVYEKIGYWNQGLGNLWEDDSGVLYSNLKKVYLFYSENNMKDEEDLATHKCVMIRHPLMKIKTFDINSSFRVSAMCIINEGKLGEELRAIENPQHIDWETKRIEDVAFRKEMNAI